MLVVLLNLVLRDHTIPNSDATHNSERYLHKGLHVALLPPVGCVDNCEILLLILKVKGDLL